MRIPRLLVPLLTLALVPAVIGGGFAATEAASQAGPAVTSAATVPPVPTLVAVRAAHHPGFDRVVFQFSDGLPASHRARYVDQLIADGSGRPVRIAGRAVLRVRIESAQAHNDAGKNTAPARRAFALPNVMTTVRSGDFEGVVTYGIGLAKRTPFHVFTLRNPARVVVDVRAGFDTVQRKVWFFNEKHFVDGTAPYFVPRWRPVRPETPATGVMDRLFAGPLQSEYGNHLRLLRSHAKGFLMKSIQDGIARVQLTGGCNSNGSTVTVAGEIMPTLRQFASVDWVKIYGPGGHTEQPTGQSDSIPACLEP